MKRYLLIKTKMSYDLKQLLQGYVTRRRRENEEKVIDWSRDMRLLWEILGIRISRGRKEIARGEKEDKRHGGQEERAKIVRI